jgi:hypothetical protein
VNYLVYSGHGSETIDIKAGESLEVSVYTRSNAGASFCLTAAGAKTHIVDNIDVKHIGTGDENEIPTSVILNKDNLVKGPVKLKIKADSQGSRFSTHNYLLVFCFKAGN